MSFNENNYSVNYLIWDQETNESSRSARVIKKYEKQFEAMGQKNMKLVSLTFDGRTRAVAPDGNKFHYHKIA